MLDSVPLVLLKPINLRTFDFYGWTKTGGWLGNDNFKQKNWCSNSWIYFFSLIFIQIRARNCHFQKRYDISKYLLIVRNEVFMEMKPDDQAQTLVNMKNILMWKFTPPPTYYTNVSAHNGFIMHIVQAAVWIKAVLKMNQVKFIVIFCF